MNEERAFELLSAAADDDLTDAERAELDRLLEESAEAREMQVQLNQFEEQLAAVPDVDPPADMHSRILGRAALPAAPAPRSGWSFRDWLHPIRSGAVLRYGFSAAFGALLVIAVYESQPDLGSSPDITEMVGTLAPDGAGRSRTLLDTYSVERTGVSSIARLEERDGALVVDIRIDTTQPVEIAMDLAAAGLEFEAVAQTRSTLESIQLVDQVLRVKGRGQRRFAVLLRTRAGASPTGEATINLEYSSNGNLLQQGSLSAAR